LSSSPNPRACVMVNHALHTAVVLQFDPWFIR